MFFGVIFRVTALPFVGPVNMYRSACFVLFSDVCIVSQSQNMRWRWLAAN